MLTFIIDHYNYEIEYDYINKILKENNNGTLQFLIEHTLNNKKPINEFFQILDENGDGSFDYNEVYNLSLISLQRVLPNNEKKEGDSKKEENEEKDEENITHILAEFLTKYVFELVGIDIDGEIPIELLRAKMDERDDKSEYLEFFLCADNFA